MVNQLNEKLTCFQNNKLGLNDKKYYLYQLKRIKIKKKYEIALNDLIDSLKDSGFLTDNQVESAFRNIPRHEFVPTSELNRAYYN